MALYDLAQLQQLISDGQWDFLNEVSGRRWYGEAYKLMDKLDWTESDVAEMLCGLTGNDWQKTVPDCIVNNLPDVDTVSADQYEIHWDEEEKCSRSEPQAGCISLSLKLALVQDSNGQFVGLVTLHTSGM